MRLFISTIFLSFFIALFFILVIPPYRGGTEGGVFSVAPASAATIGKSPTNQSGLNNGLVGWWTMDGATCGTTYCTDKSGTGNTVTSTSANMPKATAGKIGQAGKFNVTGGGLNSSFVSQLNGLTKATLSVWAKRNAPSTYNTVGEYLNTSNRFGLDFYNDGILYVEVANGANTYGTYTSNDTLWHHYILVYDGTQATDATKVKLFVDGVQKSLTITGPFPTTLPTFTGVSFSIGYFDQKNSTGYQDDVRIYNRVLTQQEITQLYKMGGSKIDASISQGGLNSGLVGWWTFDGQDSKAGAGGYALDKSGNGKHGVATSAPLSASGKIGQAGKFDGVDDMYKFTNTNLGATTTVSVWAKKDNLTTTGVPIGTSATNYFFYWDGSAGFYSMSAGSGNYTYYAYTLNKKWHHYAVTRVNRSTTFYIDGVSLGTQTLPTDNTDSSVWTIGSANSLVSWGGLIDDARVYNRALSAQEIQQLYNMGK